jgi:5-methylcytosine-specific restriction endonuclease McrA
MPIRPENKGRYPADWGTISRQIREDAGQMCQRCGAPNGQFIRRGWSKDKRAIWRLTSDSAYEDGRCSETGDMVADTGEDTVDWGSPIKVVLTVAHLDHHPENCDPANLRAWCQRCHNLYDLPHRRAGIKQRAMAGLAVADLFDSERPSRTASDARTEESAALPQAPASEREFGG